MLPVQLEYPTAHPTLTHSVVRSDRFPVKARLKFGSLDFFLSNCDDYEKLLVRLVVLGHSRFAIFWSEPKLPGDFMKRLVSQVKVSASILWFALRQVNASHSILLHVAYAFAVFG
jgi:hypothetical protein